MNVICTILGLVSGLIMGTIMYDRRLKDIQAEADKARRESLSALEHEAYLRSENRRLTEANEYFKAVHSRRNLQ